MPTPDNAIGIYTCTACGESFDSQEKLRAHEKDCLQKANPANVTPKN